ncbi:MAG TPA: tetratricopeptide repeat protein [Longimicrobiales bacterium]|nr:tetratricopeptide repeat protein [Longimicrobiales bacterium]
MPAAPEPARGTPPSYLLRFGLTAATLATVTLALVLVVLPRRYVLGSGFQESGISFPATGAPFAPGETVRRPAPTFPERATEAPSDVVAPAAADVLPGPGPAELLWSMIAPLMKAERYDEAAALLEDYLADHPEDRDVLREYAVVLFWADRRDETVDVYRRLLGSEGDTEIHLLLARTLRDLDRPAEADPYYRELWARSEDPARALEWSRAWSWSEEYGPAMAILEKGLDRYPGDTELRVELARLFYYTGRLEEARATLAELDADELLEADALGLRDDVVAALAVPEPEPEEESLLEQAVRARTDGDLDRAEGLFREALADAPGDAAAWEAWADFLQYEREDYAGARDALLRVEALEGPTAARELRMARLEIWSGDAEGAEVRLTRLLADLSDGSIPAGDDPEAASRAEVLTLIGDLRRWDGDRVVADLRYRSALADDPAHPAATEGLETLRIDVARIIDEQEQPGVAAAAYGLADSDDYRRLDLAGEGRLVRGPWVVRADAGYRWLEGLSLTGAPGDLQGAYGTVELARWWRQGTVRTAVRGGGDDVGDTDAVLGAGVRLLLPGGGRVEASWDRGPAYLVLGTLQSGLAAYAQDQIRVQATRRLGALWSIAGDVQVARLSSDLSGVEDPTRVSVAASLSREVAPGLTGGAELRGLLFTEEAPEMGGRPLFWDPEGVVSGGPFVALRRPLSSAWILRGRLAAGAALMNEARIDEPNWAPQIAAEGGLGWDGRRLRATADLFYLQGQFQGYRSWGLRLRISTSGVGGGR